MIHYLLFLLCGWYILLSPFFFAPNKSCFSVLSLSVFPAAPSSRMPRLSLKAEVWRERVMKRDFGRHKSQFITQHFEAKWLQIEAPVDDPLIRSSGWLCPWTDEWMNRWLLPWMDTSIYLGIFRLFGRAQVSDRCLWSLFGHIKSSQCYLSASWTSNVWFVPFTVVQSPVGVLQLASDQLIRMYPIFECAG